MHQWSAGLGAAPVLVLVLVLAAGAADEGAGAGGAERAPYHLTYSMAARCKEHTSTRGYFYTPFYRASELTASSEPGVLLEMHFAILAASNGHVLLSPTIKPPLAVPVYEIVIGGGGNRFSELRRMQKQNTKISKNTPGILSPIHFRAFWIRITDDGSVDVGHAGEPLPFLHYEDPNPLRIKYFSFASWAGVEAKFLYDCPAPGQNATQQNATRPPPETPPLVQLTTAQRLARVLLGTRSPLAAPAPQVTVRLAVSVASLRYDAAESTLHTLLRVVATWRDEGLRWEPELYNGTTSLRLRQSQVWRPQLYVHNSVDIGQLGADTAEPVRVASSGDVALHVRAGVRSWCEGAEGGAAWPRDSYSCVLFLAPWDMHEQIVLQVSEKTEKETAFFGNEWELANGTMLYGLAESTFSPYSSLTCTEEGANNSSLLVLVLNIRRRGAVVVVLYAPLLAIMLFVLMSFWWESADWRRRTQLYGAICVVMCALLSNMEALPPGHTLPSVTILYCAVLLSAVAALALQLGVARAAARRTSTTGAVNAQAYTRFAADASDSAECSARPAPAAAPRPSPRLPPALDKLMFALYFLLYTAMLACHY